jgi:ferredoxin-thioredoxin reductase catalytic subunit
MNEQVEISESALEGFYQKMSKEAAGGGYYLNPDVEFTRDLARGILVNEKRYGYGCCPCRLASGSENEDRDIVCPCDYRDPDLTEYGTCY